MLRNGLKVQEIVVLIIVPEIHVSVKESHGYSYQMNPTAQLGKLSDKDFIGAVQRTPMVNARNTYLINRSKKITVLKYEKNIISMQYYYSDNSI